MYNISFYGYGKTFRRDKMYVPYYIENKFEGVKYHLVQEIWNKIFESWTTHDASFKLCYII